MSRDGDADRAPLGDASPEGSPRAGGPDGFESSVPVAVWNVLFTRDTSANAVFVAWEGLRLVYNGVLIAFTFALTAALGTAIDVSFWQRVIPGAVIANVCFCLGPCAEGYLALMGADRRLARAFFFVAGLSLTSLLALVVVITPGVLGWD